MSVDKPVMTKIIPKRKALEFLFKLNERMQKNTLTYIRIIFTVNW